MAIAAKVAAVFEGDGGGKNDEESNDDVRRDIGENEEAGGGDLSPRELAPDEV